MTLSTIERLRNVAGGLGDQTYRAWCIELATALCRSERVNELDRFRLDGVLGALVACEHPEQLLVLALDRWALFAAAEQTLAELWDRYYRGSDDGGRKL
jgi:hypothetical protein